MWSDAKAIRTNLKINIFSLILHCLAAAEAQEKVQLFDKHD